MDNWTANLFPVYFLIKSFKAILYRSILTIHYVLFPVYLLVVVVLTTLTSPIESLSCRCPMKNNKRYCPNEPKKGQYERTTNSCACCMMCAAKPGNRCGNIRWISTTNSVFYNIKLYFNKKYFNYISIFKKINWFNEDWFVVFSLMC